MTPARFWHHSAKGVKCGLCPHECDLAEGRRGLCGSRINIGGILRSEVYGHPCALAIDPVEKKPLLHFHPGMKTFSLSCTGCNFRCLNCQNSDISQALPSEARSASLSPEAVVEACLENGCKAIAYTYTEPLTYLEYVAGIAAVARGRGILNILVSAGYVNPEPLAEVASLFDAANIDLKSFSDEIYRHLNGGSLKPVLDTLLALKAAGVWVEVTNLLIPGVNDDPRMIRSMCSWLFDNGFSGNPLHFSRFFPRFRMKDIPQTPLSSLLAAASIAENAGIEYVYVGNVPDCSGENTICPSCGSVLVRRDGYRILDNHLSAHAEPDADSGAGSDADSSAGSDAGSGAGSDADSSAGSDAGSSAGSGSRSDSGSGCSGSRFKSGLHSDPEAPSIPCPHCGHPIPGHWTSL